MLLLPQGHARAPFALRACYLFPLFAFVRRADTQDRILAHELSASSKEPLGKLGKPGPDIAEAASGWSTCLVFGRVSAQHVSSLTILTRISGGIRGIVELQVLNEIERVLGGRIPIQHFFDLIVGTRSVFSTTLYSVDNALTMLSPMILLAPEASLTGINSNVCVITHLRNKSVPAYLFLNN